MDKQSSTITDRRNLIQTAMGQQAAELFVKNGRLLNVYSGEILEGYHVAVCGRLIAYIGSSTEMVGPDTNVIDARGDYLVPGYIDPHAHVDFWANPLALTPYFLAGGTTTVMADPHDIVGATGLAGLDLMLEMTRSLPLKFFFSLPVSCPPFPAIEGDDIVRLADMDHYLQKDEIRALSEVTPWLRLVAAEEELLDKFERGARCGKRIEGHTTGASWPKLNALVAAGLTSCHEAINADEARARLRLGLSVMLRHGSIRGDLETLIQLVTDDSPVDTRRIMFTPDWKSPTDILQQGYMDHLVQLAIQQGVSPVTAIQMATLNPAVYLGLDARVGGLAPGRCADILLVEDLRNPSPRMVIADGRVVAREGESVFQLPELPDSAVKVSWLPRRLIPDNIDADDFAVAAENVSGHVAVPVMEIIDKTITQLKDVRLPVKEGRIQAAEERDVLKIAMMNRDNSGFVIAFVTGFGARIGGLAASIAHELHKPVVIGCNENDMAAALAHMKRMGGGVALVHAGQVLAEIPLPIGGLMSVCSLTDLGRQMRALKAVLTEMGCRLEDPIFTLGFLSFSALPWIRLTPSGVLDVRRQEIIYP